MTVGKVSVSLETPLLTFVAQYQEAHQLRSKSEVVAQALMLLRAQELESQYTQAMLEWQASGEADLWDATVGDGLEEPGDAAR